MTVETLTRALAANPGQPLHLMLPDESFVPAHFHVTEVGRVQKEFVDCGGTVRSTTTCAIQVWVADDTAHRLDSTKFARIVALAAPILKGTDLPVEVEYQTTTASRFPLSAIEATPGGLLFHLGTAHTECLAPDRCGVGALSQTTGCGSAGCC